MSRQRAGPHSHEVDDALARNRADGQGTRGCGRLSVAWVAIGGREALTEGSTPGNVANADGWSRLSDDEELRAAGCGYRVGGGGCMGRKSTGADGDEVHRTTGYHTDCSGACSDGRGSVARVGVSRSKAPAKLCPA